MHVHNVIWKEGEYYVALCLNANISGFGRTRDQALKNLDDSLAIYLTTAKDSPVLHVNHVELMQKKI